MKTTPRSIICLLAALLVCFAGAPAAADLAQEFASPPASAQPWVYWFWLNGNITRKGITADLEAMKRVGIGGVLIMEVDQGAPVGPVDFMGQQWRDLFKHVVNEAGRLGLEVNMNNDAGWNGSGGPWVKPEESMQKVVWTETEVTGPKRFEGVLPQPQTIAGYYRDISVLAFPKVGDYRIPNIQLKAAYQVGGVGAASLEKLPAEMLIPRDRITDITAQMDASGRLAWDVPEGAWTIVRFGHTSTGAENAPAPATGRGLECDKMSKEGAEANFNGMMAKLIQDVGPAAGQALAATHVDSWENGSQNWTLRMREEFRRRRGYDMMSFLPAMTGRVVDSLEVSERFLWDLRRTISEMVVEYYAGHIGKLARDRGLRFTVEAYGSPCDNIPYGGQADEPMGEFWTPSGAIETCKGMACAAHVYGKPVVGAEAFTSGDGERWREHPASIKALGDRAFCEGINRFVFHRYALQPWVPERKPGMTMGPWGQHYERTQTWWDLTPQWHSYLSRCQHMLRQGLFVADICYLQPEAPPQHLGSHDRSGYDWDECGSEVVLMRMSVKDGRIVLPDGMSYRVLVLPNSPSVTPRLLAKIKELVQAGATVIGAPPSFSPSLNDYPRCDAVVKRLAAELWGDCNGTTVKERSFGKGRVIWGLAPEKVLADSGSPPDFASGLPLRWIHRTTNDTEIYFVSNPNAYNATTTATFRVAGRVPELWWPDSGRIEPAAIHTTKGSATSVMLPLGPGGSVFVVFREKAGRAPILSVSSGNKRLMAAVPDPPVKVTVHKALYGAIEDPQRTRDVRDRVQRRVDGGEYSFAVAVMAEGDDPAPSVVKTLAVDYTIEGKRYSVKGTDRETIHLTDRAVKIRVESARYGILDDPKRTRDMRDRIQRIVDAGRSSFQVAEMAQGDDPAFLVVKTLVLEYTVDGRRRTVTGTDPEMIDLAPPFFRAAPPIELRPEGGQTRMVAWEPGSYTVELGSGTKREVSVPSLPAPLEVRGPWSVSFPAGWGAPEKITMDKLISWSQHAVDGVKYFSGTATYRTTFSVSKGLLDKDRVLSLDLGDVQVIAQVKLNGNDLGTWWKPPFAADVTKLLKLGKNDLEVRVTNLWPNRMIGDEMLPEDSDRNPGGTLKSWPQWLQEGKASPTGRHTFTSWRLWKKEDAPLSSGLIGPVVIRAGHETLIR